MLATAIAIACGSGFANAEDAGPAPDAWEIRSWDRTITWRGSADDDINYLMYTLHTTATDKPGVMFSCSDKYGLNVLYSFDDVDLMELFYSRRQSRLRSVPIHMWVGDYAFDLAYYNVRRHDKVIANQKASQASIAMGAFLQNLPIRLKAHNYFDVTLDLPPADQSVHRFIEVCDKASELAERVRAAEAEKE
ncbi:hypothetical protein [Henriciella marina]|uniref:hypothetical protein n=1 Tax=Henriciella marina TaxID=453851 RepID=UPI00037CC577|nr:hypothetical protein [Henriciella marina]